MDSETGPGQAIVPHAPSARNRPVGTSCLTEEQQTRAVALLSQDPRPSYTVIARILGCHWQVVQRLDRKTRAEIDAAQAALDEYGRRLPRALPIAERVAIYARIARKADRNPFAAQRALQRIEELEGIVTRREQKAAEEPATPPGPMFVLPAGSQVAVTIGPGPNVEMLSEPQPPSGRSAWTRSHARLESEAAPAETERESEPNASHEPGSMFVLPPGFERGSSD